jgi:hypothetical protein
MKENVEQSISNTMGAVAWMAPEIIQNPRSFTYKADVYSFGMVLYEMLTKLSPIPSDVSSLQLAQKILQEDYRPPLPDDMLPAYKSIIQMCWETSPDKRPDFTQILAMLRQLKSKLPAVENVQLGDDSSTGSTSESLNMESRFMREIEVQKKLDANVRLRQSDGVPSERASSAAALALADSEEEETRKADDVDSESFKILTKVSNRGNKNSSGGFSKGSAKGSPDLSDSVDSYLENESLDSSDDKVRREEITTST